MRLPQIRLATLVLAWLVSGSPLIAQNQGDGGPGQVQIPIDVYNRLIDLTRDPVQLQRPVPAPFALGNYMRMD